MFVSSSSRLLRQSVAASRNVVRRQASAVAAAKLPSLDYDYGELEPFISGQIMELHHSKHHNTYVTNLNATLEKYADAEAKGDVATMIALQPAIKFNGGGHVNHSIFWTNLAPPSKGGGELAAGSDIAKAIEAKWGSVDNFKTTFAAQSAAVQGSGWGWLVWNKESGSLEITTRGNQDPVSTIPAHVPLLGCDVWEHAYYLDYKNVRPDYIKAFWSVVNWNNVAERFAAAK